VLGLLGTAGAGLALAPALRVLTWPFLALTMLALGRAWWLEVGHCGWRFPWGRRAFWVLVASIALAAALWTSRFLGVLGMPPL